MTEPQRLAPRVQDTVQDRAEDDHEGSGRPGRPTRPEGASGALHHPRCGRSRPMAGEATARTQVPPPAGLAWVAGAGQLCGAGLVHRCRRCRGHPAGAPLPGPAGQRGQALRSSLPSLCLMDEKQIERHLRATHAPCKHPVPRLGDVWPGRGPGMLADSTAPGGPGPGLRPSPYNI